MSDLKGILARIEKRLAATGLSAKAASKLAGAPDSIRNLHRAIAEGKRQGISTRTLTKLAGPLQTTAGWLLTGEGAEVAEDHPAINSETIDHIFEIVEESYRLVGLDEDEAAALVQLVREVAQEPPIPPTGDESRGRYLRPLSEAATRQFLKLKRFQ